MPCIVEPQSAWGVLKEKLLPNKGGVPPWIKLPSPPVALMRCIQKAQDPEVNTSELALLIERDAGLTTQILRRVNSSAEGVAQPVKSVALAIVRLGIRGTVMYLVTESMKQTMRSTSSKLLNFNTFSASNLERALFAKHLARHLRGDEELSFATALIADSLLPVVTNQAFTSYIQFAQGQGLSPVALCDFEKKEFGWTHAQMTAMIFSNWGFPDDMVCCVALHHAGTTLLQHPSLRHTAAAVSVASLIPDQLNQDPNGLRQLQELSALLPRFDVNETAHVIEAEYKKMSPELANPFPLSRRLAKRA